MLRFTVVAHCDGSALLHNRLDEHTVDIFLLIPGDIIHVNVSMIDMDVDVVHAHVAE